MDRRTFFRRSLGATALAGSYLALGKAGRLLAEPRTGSLPAALDLVAVRGGEPDAMFDAGIEALGGMGLSLPRDRRW
jgi:hypothetical protein